MPVQYGPCRSSTARAGPVRPVPVQYDPCRSITARAGPVRLVLVQYGSCRSSTARAGPVRPVPVQYGPCWSSTARAGPVRPVPIHYGPCRSSTARAGPLRTVPVQYGPCGSSTARASPVRPLPVHYGPCPAYSPAHKTRRRSTTLQMGVDATRQPTRQACRGHRAYRAVSDPATRQGGYTRQFDHTASWPHGKAALRQGRTRQDGKEVTQHGDQTAGRPYGKGADGTRMALGHAQHPPATPDGPQIERLTGYK